MFPVLLIDGIVTLGRKWYSHFPLFNLMKTQENKWLNNMQQPQKQISSPVEINLKQYWDHTITINSLHFYYYDCYYYFLKLTFGSVSFIWVRNIFLRGKKYRYISYRLDTFFFFLWSVLTQFFLNKTWTEQGRKIAYSQCQEGNNLTHWD